MRTTAVVMEGARRVGLDAVRLRPLGDEDLMVDVEWSGISSGTERLLWSGQMPDFPGMGYPLVPGYETVGRVARAGASASLPIGSRVFVPGSTGFEGVRSLFGGSAKTLVVPQARVVLVPDGSGCQSILLALAATAHHVAPVGSGQCPDLIVGHGVLGRLLARIAVLDGGSPVVWETNPARRSGAMGYRCIDPADDDTSRYHRICDVSGAADHFDRLISRLAPGGELVLAGFYEGDISFSFVPAFLREARLRVAAQWQSADLIAVARLVEDGRLQLDGLISHEVSALDADAAYRQAFEDRDCLKMVLDWRAVS